MISGLDSKKGLSDTEDGETEDEDEVAVAVGGGGGDDIADESLAAAATARDCWSPAR